MDPIRLVVTSPLPEFSGLNLTTDPFQPDITWAELFEHHNITGFDPDIHRIKSSRNNAFAHDLIQGTSSQFTGKRPIKVKLVKANNPRGRPPGSGRKYANRNQVVAEDGSVSNQPGRSPMSAPMPSWPDRQQQRRPSYKMETGAAGRRFQADPPPPILTLSHLNYAESIASQETGADAVAGNAAYSVLKARFVREIQRVPNSDFDSMRQELKNLVDGEYRYRWIRKAPMCGSLLLQAFNV